MYICILKSNIIFVLHVSKPQYRPRYKIKPSAFRYCIFKIVKLTDYSWAYLILHILAYERICIVYALHVIERLSEPKSHTNFEFTYKANYRAIRIYLFLNTCHFQHLFLAVAALSCHQQLLQLSLVLHYWNHWQLSQNYPGWSLTLHCCFLLPPR